MPRPITLHIETGPGGWLKAFWRRSAGDPENVIFCRFRAPVKKRQRWALVGLHASRDSQPPWLSSSLLAAVPRHRIEVAVTASKDVFQKGLLEYMDVAIDPDDLDASFKRAYNIAPRPKLERPPRGKLDDDFYREVALAYRWALAAGRSPLDTLVADSGVPRGTIARWVAAARDRGFLPPTTPGRVSA